MTKNEKKVVIDNLTAKLTEYPHFYLTGIASQVLREQCYSDGR